MNDVLDAYLNKTVESRRATTTYRTRIIKATRQSAEVVVGGRRLVSFSSNDYLGLASHPRIIAAYKRAADTYGVGSSGSPLMLGHTTPVRRLEKALSKFLQRPSALLFSTGYSANLGILSALVERNDLIYMDRLNHASLVDGSILCRAKLSRYPHADIKSLETYLLGADRKRKWVVSDGVFSMDGDIAPLPELARLCQKYSAWLIVDDAHGLGILGSTGHGVVGHSGLNVAEVPVLIGAFGKAFGVAGAFVAGSRKLIEYLIQTARSFVYSTAMPPAQAAAIHEGLMIIQTESWRRERLNALITRFKKGAQDLDIPLLPSVTPIQPLLLGSNRAALQCSETLKAKGLYVSAVRPPTVPQGSARLRITLSANHTDSHVDRLLVALKASVCKS